jgi:hypothetical protein
MSGSELAVGWVTAPPTIMNLWIGFVTSWTAWDSFMPPWKMATQLLQQP